jgi:hypothetical protein
MKSINIFKIWWKKSNNFKMGNQINLKNVSPHLGVIALFSSFFSSPGPKGHVRYCHHLASIVRPLTFSYFNLLLWNNLAKWNQKCQSFQVPGIEINGRPQRVKFQLGDQILLCGRPVGEWNLFITPSFHGDR